MRTILERVQKEEEELNSRVVKLDDFIDNNPVFATLDDVQRVLLVTQLNAMKMYLYTVQERIYHLNKKTENN